MCIEDKLAAYQFDAAVTAFGLTVSNALLETVEMGAGTSKRRVPRYRLEDLLRDDFHFPDPNKDLGIFKSLDVYEEVG